MSIAEKIQDLKKHKFIMYKNIREDLTELGFETMMYRDAKYMTKGDIYVFNCPHICSKVKIFRDFPELGDHKAFSSLEEYHLKADEKIIEVIHITPEDAMDFNLISSYIVNQVMLHLND